jgi:hypothetical protein
MLNLKTIFEEEAKDLAIDASLVKRIADFQIGFTNKNDDHMTFFGGNLTGVQRVRFTSSEVAKWFTDVIMLDDITLEERLLKLPTINKEFHISSDVFNLSVIWVIHAILNSPHLNDKQKHNGAVDAALILQYKFLTSLMANWFKYPADPETAAAVYAQLSYKFALKQHGSWSATLRNRSEDLISEHGIHRECFTKFNDDLLVVRTLNDTQGRIRDMLKNIYGVIVQLTKDGVKLKTTTQTMQHEGEEILKDKSKNLQAYTRYIQSIITDRNSFIKNELLSIVNNLMYTMPPKLLIKCLEWISSNYRQPGAIEVEKLVPMVMTHSFSYIEDNRNVLKESNGLASMVARLRGVYTSSRSTDMDLQDIRDTAENVVVKATNMKNVSVIASLRTAICLYLILRAYTMHHYA